MTLLPTAKGEQMTLAIEAAKLLGRPPVPLPPDWGETKAWCGQHLRIVDPQCRETWAEESDVPDRAANPRESERGSPGLLGLAIPMHPYICIIPSNARAI